MKNYIDMTLLLDSSGSMQSIKADMEGALANLLTEQKQFDDVVVSFYYFNSPGNYHEVFVAKPINDVDNIVFNPEGMTALIDAWCITIDKTGKRLAKMNEKDRPSKVLFVVITDGEENSSKEFTKKQLEERIKKQEEQYNWKFQYLGANQVASEVAYNYGMRRGRTSSYDSSSSGIKEMSYMMGDSFDMMRNNNWKAEDTSDTCASNSIPPIEPVTQTHKPKKKNFLWPIKNSKKDIDNINLGSRIAPNHIIKLADTEIFVFGSNHFGQHDGGAAKMAMQWGAIWGQGVGLQGQTYAIPTMHGGINEIKTYIDDFIVFAESHPEYKFLVTEIGCGIAGFKPTQIAPLFEKAKTVQNIYLPQRFIDILLTKKAK